MPSQCHVVPPTASEVGALELIPTGLAIPAVEISDSGSSTSGGAGVVSGVLVAADSEATQPSAQSMRGSVGGRANPSAADQRQAPYRPVRLGS